MGRKSEATKGERSNGVRKSEVAFLVQQYLLEQHYERSLAEFRAEAGSILAAANKAAPRSAKGLQHILNEYLALLLEQSKVTREREEERSRAAAAQAEAEAARAAYEAERARAASERAGADSERGRVAQLVNAISTSLEAFKSNRSILDANGAMGVSTPPLPLASHPADGAGAGQDTSMAAYHPYLPQAVPSGWAQYSLPQHQPPDTRADRATAGVNGAGPHQLSGHAAPLGAPVSGADGGEEAGAPPPGKKRGRQPSSTRARARAPSSNSRRKQEPTSGGAENGGGPAACGPPAGASAAAEASAGVAPSGQHARHLPGVTQAPNGRTALGSAGGTSTNRSLFPPAETPAPALPGAGQAAFMGGGRAGLAPSAPSAGQAAAAPLPLPLGKHQAAPQMPREAHPPYDSGALQTQLPAAAAGPISAAIGGPSEPAALHPGACGGTDPQQSSGGAGGSPRAAAEAAQPQRKGGTPRKGTPRRRGSGAPPPGASPSPAPQYMSPPKPHKPGHGATPQEPLEGAAAAASPFRSAHLLGGESGLWGGGSSPMRRFASLLLSPSPRRSSSGRSSLDGGGGGGGGQGSEMAATTEGTAYGSPGGSSAEDFLGLGDMAPMDEDSFKALCSEILISSNEAPARIAEHINALAGNSLGEFPHAEMGSPPPAGPSAGALFDDMSLPPMELDGIVAEIEKDPQMARFFEAITQQTVTRSGEPVLAGASAQQAAEGSIIEPTPQSGAGPA